MRSGRGFLRIFGGFRDPSLTAFWAWDGFGTQGSTTKDTSRSRLGFSSVFGGFRDPILKAFEVPWTNKVCLFILVSMSLFLVIFWV